MEAARIFDEVFSHARESDEFEYACALLRVRGMEDVGWDPLTETATLFNEVVSLLQAPLGDYTRVRLGLLLYSHLTEVDAIYLILVNMIKITAGQRYSMDPFGDLYRPTGRPRFQQYPPSAKRVVERVKERAAARGCNELEQLLDWFFNDAVRNAFFHSDYVIFKDEFRSREGRFVGRDGVRSPSMKLTEITDLINRGMTFYRAFVETYEEHRGSYTEEKRVRGRVGADGSVQDVMLMASSDRGLFGIRG